MGADGLNGIGRATGFETAARQWAKYNPHDWREQPLIESHGDDQNVLYQIHLDVLLGRLDISKRLKQLAVATARSRTPLKQGVSEITLASVVSVVPIFPL